MTLDKIIQGLKAVRTIHNGNYTPQIDSAIHILQQIKPELEPCEDCVSREEAIRVAEQGQIQGYEWQFREICNLPSVTPQTKWIPVSERLPEDYIHVLCQFTLGGMGECYLAHGVFHVVGGLVMTCNEVIAWMPLPESYKEDSND